MPILSCVALCLSAPVGASTEPEPSGQRMAPFAPSVMASTRARSAPIEPPPAHGSLDGVLVTNNACASPAVLAGTGTFFFDNRSASTDGLPHPACDASGSSQIHKDLWIIWIAQCDGLAYVETCGLAALDTRIAVYSPAAPCPPTSDYVIGCDDDACGVQSRVVFQAIAGQEYRIRLGQFNATAPGAIGEARIECAPGAGVCHYDDCQPSSGLDAYFSEGATARIAEDFIPGSSGAVSGACWWGVYVDAGADPDDFRITYYEDLNGLPGRPIAVFYQGYDMTVRGPVPSGNVIAGAFQEYEYSASHPPISVDRLRKYWVEIVNNLGAQSWAWSDTVGGHAVQDDSPTNGYANSTIPPIPGRAFCLGFASACPTDTNGDGLINFADLNKVLSAFGTACP